MILLKQLNSKSSNLSLNPQLKTFLWKCFQITLLFFVLTLLTVRKVAAVGISYQRTANTPNIYSSIPREYVSTTANIIIIVSPGDLAVSYNVLFWRPNTAAPANSPFRNHWLFCLLSQEIVEFKFCLMPTFHIWLRFLLVKSTGKQILCNCKLRPCFYNFL